MNRSGSWNRHKYPVQAGPPAAPNPQQVAEQEQRIPDKPAVPQLPKHIPAVKDGRNHETKGRTIIIALDGTGDKFDSDNSSIVHLVGCLKKHDPDQISYYQSGIGTYDGGGLSNGFNAAFDMAVGSGLGVHIRDAYKFLMQTYKEHDRICMFGFSRGAYTARCLAGMVHKVGLLPAHNVAQIPFAYEFYKDDTTEGWEMSQDFKRTFCTDVNVYFVGVFDSVASVGFIPRKLPLSSTPTNKAAYFRHAMALDEHRAKFKVSRFKKRDHIGPDEKWSTIAEAHEAPDGNLRRFSADLGMHNGDLRKSQAGSSSTRDEKEKEHDEPVQGLGAKLDRHGNHDMATRETDVLEVWFAGAHADVGGGAVKNEVRHKLSQIPLRWMIRQCFECNTGIIFNVHRLAEEGIDVHTLWPLYTPLQRPTIGPPPSFVEKYEKNALGPIQKRKTALSAVDDDDKDGLYHINIYQDAEQQQLADHWIPEQVEDYFDAIADVNDQLVVAKGWWILEIWPIKVRLQPAESDEWIKKVSLNLGRFRVVQEHEPNLHWTVKHRMEYLGYKVRTRNDRNSVWRIVV